MNRLTGASRKLQPPRQSRLVLRQLSSFTTVRAQDTDNKQQQEKKVEEQAENEAKKPKKKTMAELDEEMRMAMEGTSGDGGAAGLELEGGKAVSMKRGVRENMFRYI